MHVGAYPVFEVIEKLSGEVRKERIGVGSKSEHDAVMLLTDDGRFRLQRKNANPFDDPKLDGLVGKRIEARGQRAGPSFVVEDDIIELQPEQADDG